MKYYLLGLAGLVLFFASACKKDTTPKKNVVVYDNGPTDSLKINQIQVIASHNSYHLKTDSVVFAFLTALDSLGLLPAAYSPTGIDYWHLPVEQQFNDYNVRGLELDIYNDPNGGQFYYRAGPTFSGYPNTSNEPKLLLPGFKVIHIVDFDYNSIYVTFKDALQAIYDWSQAHPNHLPIFINIETKEDVPADVLTTLPGLTHAIPYDASACDAIDAEIKSIFGAELNKVITPDDVRGNYSTLEAAALAGNWPQLATSRGKVVFIMQGAAESLYKNGHPSLQGRAMFVYSNPGTSEAAFVILNSSKGSYAEIQQRVSQGYIVRTRADDGTDEARVNDVSSRDAAFCSWAQIVSTDYYRADPRAGTPGWTDYHVQFSGGEIARIDSISAHGQQNLGLIKE
ncbi:MAG: Ca2+-dependent phosphoinositide-specific phospholipase C [Chitinophagales bacterium]